MTFSQRNSARHVYRNQHNRRMTHIHVTVSKNKLKKYSAFWMDENGDKISRLTSFGQFGAEDFTEHHDEKRRIAYLRRHGGIEEGGFSESTKEDWGRPQEGEPVKAGWLSRNLLWREKSLVKAAREVEETTGIKIVLDPSIIIEE